MITNYNDRNIRLNSNYSIYMECLDTIEAMEVFKK